MDIETVLRLMLMTLRKTVEGFKGVYRIFECAPSMFLVLDADGRTVDEFDLVDRRGVPGGKLLWQASRKGKLRLGAPNLAPSFVAELNAVRLRQQTA